VRLLLDEMISPRIADALRAAGHDTLAVAEEVTLRALPDDELLEQATAATRILVTRNVADFARLHAQWLAEGRRHHGLVMVTQRSFPQNRSFVGALTAALLHCEELPQIAEEGALFFLQRAASAE